MNGRARFPGKLLVVAGVLFAALAGLVFFAGCEHHEPAAQQAQQGQQMPMHEHASADQAQTEVVAAVAEQTTCPVMGGPINKAIFTEYKGKKVYFCCKGCDQKFQENPEQYVAKLPQFQE